MLGKKKKRHREIVGKGACYRSKTAWEGSGARSDPSVAGVNEPFK